MLRQICVICCILKRYFCLSEAVSRKIIEAAGSTIHPLEINRGLEVLLIFLFPLTHVLVIGSSSHKGEREQRILV